MSNDYSERNIKILSDLDHIRLRMGMYIGENSDPRHLFSEAFDNAVDELQTGNGTEIQVIVDTKNNEYTVKDNGRGIPHGMKKMGEEDVEIIKLLCVKSNTGAKFDSESYLMSAGLHGVGLAVINALSKQMVITSERDGKSVSYSSASDFITYEVCPKTKHGTTISFIPDKQYFQQPIITVEYLTERCRTANAFGITVKLLVDGVPIELATQLSDLIKKEEGIKEYGEYPLITTSKDKNTERLILLLQYTSDTKDKYYGYTNLLYNSQGGSHVNFISTKIISSAWEEYIKKSGIKPQVELKRGDYLTGLRCVVAAFISNPSFAGQTKEKLSVDKARFDSFADVCQKEVVKALKSNETLSNALIKRFEEYRISQNKLLSRKEISSFIKQNSDSPDSIRRKFICDKLVDCSSKSRDDTELYICLKGDTRIKLLNGEEKEIASLVGNDDFWVYSIDEQGNYAPTQAYNVRETKRVGKLLKLTFSDGSVVECTPEHRFMLRGNLNWIEAQDIRIGESLLSLKTRKIQSGYEQIYTGPGAENGWRLTHRLTALQLGIIPEFDGVHYLQVHHKDCNRLNNDPSNFEILEKGKHGAVHFGKYNGSEKQREDFQKMLKDPEKLERIKMGSSLRTPEGVRRSILATKKSWEGNTNPSRTWERYNKSEKSKLDRARVHADPEYRKKISQSMKRIIETTDYCERMSESVIKSKTHTVMCMIQDLQSMGYELNEENFKKVWKNGLPGIKYIKAHFTSFYEAEEAARNYNLRLVSKEIVEYDEPIPVYCLTVRSNSQAYSLFNGLITHNCEGASAAGPACRMRKSETQAVLQLKGKILNVTGMEVQKAIKSEEVCNITNSIGCGIGSQCDSERSRYERVLINADGDEDGYHIVCLVLSVFVNLLPDIVKSGRLFVVVPPLYGWHDKQGSHFTNDKGEIPPGAKLKRYKGLGSMSDKDFYGACMDSKNRVLIQVDYPTDIDAFNKILGTSSGKSEILKDLGLIRYE